MIELFFLWYFTSINTAYAFFMLIGAFSIFSRKKELETENIASILSSESLPALSFVIPMYNETALAIANIHNLLSLSYRYKQIIIINDGSEDETFSLLQKSFFLVPIPKYYSEPIPTQKVRGVYQSKTYPEILVIDKEHGGKFDADNAALNAMRTPYFVVIDADTFIDDERFETLIRPLFSDPATIAIGASVRLINGCTLDFNRITTANFPQKFLPAMQGLEYLRAFLLRQGLSVTNGIFVISGAFSAFRRDVIVSCGGFCNSVAEDVEIAVRLHRIMRIKNVRYRIRYLPDPVAWTIAPESLAPLGRQRCRWHFGTLESLWYHKKLLFNPFFGSFGLLVYPIVLFAEALEPIIELFAWAYVVFLWIAGTLDLSFLYLLLAVSFGFTVICSLFSLLLEELSFRKYPSLRSLVVLLVCNLLENFGYRQLTIFWRLKGFKRFIQEFAHVRKECKRIKQCVKTATKTNR